MTVFVHSEGIYEGPTSGEPWLVTERSGGRRRERDLYRDSRGTPVLPTEVAAPCGPTEEREGHVEYQEIRVHIVITPAYTRGVGWGRTHA